MNVLFNHIGKNGNLSWQNHLVLALFLSFFINPLLAENAPHSFPGVLPLIGFRVNEGNPYTNTTDITVEVRSMNLKDSLVAEMKIGLEPDLSSVPWIPYTTDKINLTLPDGDGEKFIYCRLKDMAGNISPIEATRVILDTSPPTGVNLSINRGDQYTNDEKRRVLIYIQTTDDEIAEMIFSNRKDFTDAQWEKFAETKRWILSQSGGDGIKYVYARFKDRAGNISDMVEESIILDTEPPRNGSVVINDDALYTQNREVELRISADDAYLVRVVSPHRSNIFQYETAEGENYMVINWTLDSIDGTKVVRVYFMDEARNRTTNVIQDEIILDRTGPPPPFISINGDNKYTNDTEGLVTIRLGARVNPELIQMMISNYNDFRDANPQDFRNQINNWKLLAEEDGMKTVYARYIDQSGNYSETSMAKIILDRVPPEIKEIYFNEGSKWATSTKVTIHMNVEDAAKMQINNTPAISSMVMWEPYTPKKVDWNLVPGDGKKTIYCRFKDPAENVTPVVSTEVTLDTKPPEGDLIINEGAKFTNDPNQLVTLLIKSQEAKGMQITNKPDFSDVKLEPLKDTVQNWQLTGEDGIKTVFLRLRDEAGNFSNVITSSIILDRKPPGELKMVINEGEPWLRNPSRRASVQLNAKGASHYRLNEKPDFNSVEWEIFKNVTAWVFSPEEGEKQLYAQFKDPAGNISEPVSSSIKLDYTPPSCKEFSIDGGADFTNNPQKKVRLTINSPDAVKMAISNTPISDPTATTTQWEDHAMEKDWILEGEDGLKTVYLVLRDQAGNFSGRYNDRIILDRVGPTECSAIVNEGKKFVPPGPRKIPVELNANGADKVIIAEDPSFSEARWQLYIPKIVYEVTEGDGIKTIFIKFRDKALNETQVFADTVILDSKPPEAIDLTLNEGEMYTNEPSKTIKIQIEAREAKEMRISQKDLSPGVWEPFAKEKTYTLKGEDGEKELGVFLRDEAGNVSEPLISTVILDRTPPKPTSFIIDDGRGWTNNKDKKVTLNFKVGGASQMMISTNPEFNESEWQNYSSTIEDFILPGEDGEKRIFAKFRDEAGNISPAISAKVNLKRSF